MYVRCASFERTPFRIFFDSNHLAQHGHGFLATVRNGSIRLCAEPLRGAGNAVAGRLFHWCERITHIPVILWQLWQTFCPIYGRKRQLYGTWGCAHTIACAIPSMHCPMRRTLLSGGQKEVEK